MYIDQLIDSKDIEKYGNLIPECFHERIRREELFAVETRDPCYPGLDLIGVTVSGVRDSWAEILWYSMTDNYNHPFYVRELIRKRVRDAKLGGEAAGVYCSFPKDFENGKIAEILSDIGFEVREASSRVLQFTLRGLNSERLPEHIDRSSFIPVKFADTLTLRKLSSLMADDPRNIPVDIPVPWERYDPELSIIHLEKGVPAGTILITRRDNRISADLAYETTPTGILRLVSFLIKEAEKKLSPDTIVTVPIVNDRLFSVMKIIAPEAERKELVKAVYILP